MNGLIGVLVLWRSVNDAIGLTGWGVFFLLLLIGSLGSRL